MVFVAFGINHKSAPLSLREKIAFNQTQLEEHIQSLLSNNIAREAILLSTCNRTEIYCILDEPEQLMPWFADQQNILLSSLAPYTYQHLNEDAIRHVLRVASGLDSMMLGEPQILGQIKQAYQSAHNFHAIHRRLRSIFQFVFSASKRIRHQSGIGNNPISIAYAAVLHIKKFFTLLSSRHIFIIGSGETAALVAKYLHKEGVTNFTIASRTEENAEKLSLKFQAKSLTITDIPAQLPKADIVISATACPLPFINKKMVERALTKRNQEPMFFLDLAVPRDIEPEVASLENVHLYNIDDLHKTIEKGMDARQKAALFAEQLIEKETENYIKMHRSLRATNVICDYRNQMESVAKQELLRATQKLNNGNCQYNVLTEFCDRLMKKLMHKPTVGLRQAASDERDELLDLAHYLFSYEKEQHEEVT